MTVGGWGDRSNIIYYKKRSCILHVHFEIDFIFICKRMQTQSKLDIVDEKYQRTIIYGIICMITGEMYVGSTVKTLDARIRLHCVQRNCRAWQILERGNYKAYVIQHWPCNTLREVLTLEGGWQRAYKASFGDFFVNKYIEGYFTNDSPEAKHAYNEEYRKTHREQSRINDKKYRETHKEQIIAYRKIQWTCNWCNKTMRFSSQYNHKKTCKSKPNE